MIKNTPIFIIILALFVTTPVLALDEPKGGDYDHRIRFIDYNSADVVKLVGHYGYSTHVQFSQREKINQIAMGDPKAWDVRSVENHIFIKPIAKGATTNMTVITTSRVYNFDLSAHWSKKKSQSNDMYFQINFKYPEFEKQQHLNAQAQVLAQAQAKEQVNSMKRHFNETHEPSNWNYWVKGAADIAPSQAYDNGRFTYLSFDNNKEMPAIYTVDNTGAESLVNTSIDPNNKSTIIVHSIAQRLILRKGSSVSCIFNKSFDPLGISNNTGTTSKAVERKIKGQSDD